MRGNPLSVAQMAPELVTQQYDLLLATASVDLATIQSIYPALRTIPSILYFHDNQFEYPTANNPQSVVDWQITHIYSAIRANKLLFNSQYNKDSFLAGVMRLMKKMPDLAPKDLHNSLQEKSSVLPVPIPSPTTTKLGKSNSTLKLLWNHRCEWDKCPDLLEAVVSLLATSELSVEVFITGQQFRNEPENFTRIRNNTALVRQCAFIEDETAYQLLLSQCDVVLSTAVHEFQGIAILEAVAAGCVPLLPKRLSYPEMFANKYLYATQGSIEQQAIEIVKKLSDWQKSGLPATPDVSKFYRSQLKAKYEQII
jgi:hypothetical protein